MERLQLQGEDISGKRTAWFHVAGPETRTCKAEPTLHGAGPEADVRNQVLRREAASFGDPREQAETLDANHLDACRFQSANRIRRQQRDRAHTTDAADESVPDTVDVAQQVVDAELAALILAEVRGLSVIDREIFRLCAVEGYAYSAAAAELGVAHGVVRNRLSRIRSRLRSVVSESAITESEST